ncbi:hypothetical protein EVAR_3531_1 [Eumeta japonica]|uniref:Uncharacterized protein n=1 Tax=Eumeta variegata TaxID=151549 RepID=A0A4C1SVD3_EUMVA|nr:hypothetical protein EVAR_3531_1 [Eumeta japonica]
MPQEHVKSPVFIASVKAIISDPRPAPDYREGLGREGSKKTKIEQKLGKHARRTEREPHDSRHATGKPRSAKKENYRRACRRPLRQKLSDRYAVSCALIGRASKLLQPLPTQGTRSETPCGRVWHRQGLYRL